MSRAVAALKRGRRRAESLMVDACVIRRVTGEPGPIDPETGLRDPAPTTVVYPLQGAQSPLDGRCKIQTWEPHEGKPESGEHVFTVQRYYVHLPIGAGRIQVDDRVEITASEAAAQLVGRTYRVAGTHAKSLATAQRVLVDEVTG